MATLTDYLNSINKKTLYIEQDEVEMDYPAFIINRGMSQFIDTVIYANEMNMFPECPKNLQYLFYYNSVPKKSRFSKWAKKSKIKDIDVIKEFYNYSDAKAEEALKILTDKQVEDIKDRLFKGGR